MPGALPSGIFCLITLGMRGLSRRPKRIPVSKRVLLVSPLAKAWRSHLSVTGRAGVCSSAHLRPMSIK